MAYLKLFLNLVVGALAVWLIARGPQYFQSDWVMSVFLWLPLALAALVLNAPRWLVRTHWTESTSARVLGLFALVDDAEPMSAHSTFATIIFQVIAIVVSVLMVMTLIDEAEKPLVMTILIVSALLTIGLNWLKTNQVRLTEEPEPMLSAAWQGLPVLIALLFAAHFFTAVSAYWGQYIQFADSGVTTQATVLYRRYDPSANTHYVVYRFSPVGQPDSEYVAQDQGDLEVEVEVPVVYLAQNPLISALAQNSQFPIWQAAGLVLSGAISLALLAVRALRLAAWRTHSPARTGRWAQWLDTGDRFLSPTLLATALAVWIVRFSLTNEVGRMLIFGGALFVLMILARMLFRGARPIMMDFGQSTWKWLRPRLSDGGRSSTMVASRLLSLVYRLAVVPWRWLGQGLHRVGSVLLVLWRGLEAAFRVLVIAPLRWLWVGAMRLFHGLVAVPLGWLGQGLHRVGSILLTQWHGLEAAFRVLVIAPLRWLWAKVMRLFHGLVVVPLGWLGRGLASGAQTLAGLWNGLMRIGHALIVVPLGRLVDGLTRLAGAIAGLWAALSRWLSQGWTWGGNLLGRFWNGVTWIFTTLVVAPITWLGRALLNGIVDLIVGVGNGCMLAVGLLRKRAGLVWGRLLAAAMVVVMGVVVPLAWVARLLRRLWNGLAGAIRAFVSVPIGWLGKGWALAVRALVSVGAGLTHGIHLLISVPLGWIGRGAMAVLDGGSVVLAGFSLVVVRAVAGPLGWVRHASNVLRDVFAGLAATLARWIRFGLVAIANVAMVAVGIAALVTFAAGATDQWHQYTQFDATAPAFVIANRHDANSGKNYVTYRFSISGPQGSDYVAEAEGDLAVDSRVDVAYLSTDPATSTLAVSRQSYLWWFILLLGGGVVSGLWSSYFSLPFIRWVNHFFRLDRRQAH